MEERKDITVPMEKALVEEIGEELDYGDSRAAWIRQAIREKLERDRAGGNESGNGNAAATAAAN